ncbi:MAG: hypothetical protein DDG60_04905 [Anaerolineae bacterium]|nr:MAG: hypothetical protein DDG60_04905 [Anaerolineae bacterium]
MAVISLMTDFGLKDGNVGVMKGVIWKIAPQAQISDLSHLISPQNIAEAALILYRSAPYFPDFSIHLVVVDPGVGTARRPMAARLGNQYYVGPDNGTITLLLELVEQQNLPTHFIHLNKPEYWLPNVSYVFHGRDIFAPVAARLAAGTPLEALGTPFDDPVRLALPQPERTAAGWRGQVIHVDHFGNIASNIRVEHLGEMLQHKERLTVRVRGAEIHGLVNTFGERTPGTLVALIGSTGNLLACLVNGNAQTRLGVQIGDAFEVVYE